jgi:D-sedoheptulose 7-phosphate isomerase
MDAIALFLGQTSRLLEQLDRDAIARARDLLLACHRCGGRVFTLGNGGSASTAQHFACDLAKFAIPPGERPFDARCLTDNVSLYTAWANDAERADVFVNLLRGLLQRGDLVIACSVHGGQGFSADLVRAVRFANETGASTLSLVGFDGGSLHHDSTVSVRVPVASTPQVEAIHLVIEHLLMSLIKQALGGSLDEGQRVVSG